MPAAITKNAAPVDKAKLDKDFGAAMAARPEIPVKYLLYFENGGTRLTPEAQALIPRIFADAGKRNLLVKTPDNTPEAKNRRVEVSVR